MDAQQTSQQTPDPQPLIRHDIFAEDIVNNPDWQSPLMPDDIEPLTREEHLQCIAFGSEAAYAKNPVLAEKALRNLAVTEARYPEMMTDLPVELSLGAMVPFEHLLTTAHPAYSTPRPDDALIIDEPDQAINDIDIDFDRQGIAHSFAVARTDPLLYRFCCEQKEAMGLETFSDALMVRWYRVGRKKLMQEDAEFAAMFARNLELGLRRMREAAEAQRSANNAFLVAWLEEEMELLQEAMERLVRYVDEVDEALQVSGRNASEDGKGEVDEACERTVSEDEKGEADKARERSASEDGKEEVEGGSKTKYVIGHAIF